jgi:hypothetical protein
LVERAEIRAQLAEEEAEAIAEEIAENKETALSVRVPRVVVAGARPGRGRRTQNGVGMWRAE